MMMFKSCTKQCLSISTDGSESCMDNTGKFSYSLRSKAHLCRPKLELPPLEDPSYVEPVLNAAKASNAAEPLYDEVLYAEEPIYVEGPIYAEAIELSTSSAEEHAEESADERETSVKERETSVYYANNNHCIFTKKRTFKKKCHRLYFPKRYSFSSTTNTEESTMDTDEIINKNMEDMDYNFFHWHMYSTRCSTPLYSQVLNPSSASIISTIETISEEDGNIDENKDDIVPSMQKAIFKPQVDQACVYKDNNMVRSISYWLPKRKPIKLLCGGHVEQMIKKYTIANSNCRNEEKLFVEVNVCQKTGYVKDMVKHYLENIKKHEIEINNTNYNKNLKVKAI